MTRYLKPWKAPLWVPLSATTLAAVLFLALDWYMVYRVQSPGTGLAAVVPSGIVFNRSTQWSAGLATSSGYIRRAAEASASKETGFQDAGQSPLSTMAADVDTASWSMVRASLRGGARPDPNTVRVEEMVNYFPYAYPDPVESNGPLALAMEIGRCPWKAENRLLRIGIKTKPIEAAQRRRAQLTFLIDVSGSMATPEKLPLVKRSLAMLIDQLRDDDTVAVVVYAGSEGVALPPTAGSMKRVIREAVEGLGSGGSTAGEAGIRKAYELARQMHRTDATNRVILATDGDFNVGVQSREELIRLIEAERDHGVYLTALGFGLGGYRDEVLETLADHGNGQYAYIDSITEARRVLVEQVGGTLETVAQDVKLQVEFNPARVRSYRLIGYENRRLTSEEFRNDRKDAGDLGAGHMVTALYELVPNGSSALPADAFTIRVRYKKPGAWMAQETVHPGAAELDSEPTTDFRFAAAVAQFGLLLSNSSHAGAATWESTLALAKAASGTDERRLELVELVERAAKLP